MTTPTPTNLTLPERRADEVLEIIREQRRKGRATYGKGLDHRDAYDWQRMAIEELVDAVQYLAAENLRLRDRCAVLDEARGSEPLDFGVREERLRQVHVAFVGAGSMAEVTGATQQEARRRLAMKCIRTALDILEGAK